MAAAGNQQRILAFAVFISWEMTEASLLTSYNPTLRPGQIMSSRDLSSIDRFNRSVLVSVLSYTMFKFLVFTDLLREGLSQYMEEQEKRPAKKSVSKSVTKPKMEKKF